MGVDATGQAFNSIVAIEQYKGARDESAGERGRDHRDQHGEGGKSRDEIWNKILGTTATFAGATADGASRRSTSPRPRRISAIRRSAMLMYAYGHIKDNPDQATRPLHASSAPSA